MEALGDRQAESPAVTDRPSPLDVEERAELLALRAHNARLLDHIGQTLIEVCGEDDASIHSSATRLLDLGADPNHFDPDTGLYPLINAVHGGTGVLVDLLLSRGAHPNAADDRNLGSLTLMHIASAYSKNRPEFIRALLVAGGDPSVVRSEGSALDMAIKNGASPEIVHMMRSAVAKRFAQIALDVVAPVSVQPMGGKP